MNIIVVGKNSYIGGHFIKYYKSIRPEDTIKVITVRDDSWIEVSFADVDAIIYFAAIVHHPEIKDEKLYYKVNAELPFQVAKKAKENGVKHFIFISTVAVYGIGPVYGEPNVINKETPYNPSGLYGKSKLKGEESLRTLKDASFMVTIVRLPNVYGPECPGTFYHRLELLSKFPVLPISWHCYKFSLISVDNVAKFITKVIRDRLNGTFIPQDTEPISIIERIKRMAHANGHNQYQTKIFAPLIWLVNKIYPNKYINNLYGGYYIVYE